MKWLELYLLCVLFAIVVYIEWGEISWYIRRRKRKKAEQKIICWQIKIYPKPRPGKDYAPYYKFEKAKTFGHTYPYSTKTLLEPIAAWRIKELKK